VENACCSLTVSWQAAISGASSTGQRQPRAAASHSPSPPKLSAERGRAGKRGRPASKCRASCAVCKMTRCKLGCPGRVNTGQDVSSDAGVPCRKSRTGAGDQGDDGEASGVRGRERGMQGPGDSDAGVEATPDARSVSAHGRAGGVRGRQRERMESTLLEGRGRARRRLGEAQDADQGEIVTQAMPGGGRNRSGGARGADARGSRESGRGTTAASERDSTAQLGSQRPVQGSASKGLGDTASSHQTGSESRPRKRPVRTVASRIVSVLGAEWGLDLTTVLLSEVSDWMEQLAHVIRICGERYTPPHKWSHLQ